MPGKRENSLLLHGLRAGQFLAQTEGPATQSNTAKIYYQYQIAFDLLHLRS